MTKPLIPYCSECGSTDISADAIVHWNVVTQTWDATDVEYSLCSDCGEEDTIEWKDYDGELNSPDQLQLLPDTEAMKASQ